MPLQEQAINNITDWYKLKINNISNISKILSGAAIWAFFEVLGIFHSLSPNLSWTLADINLFISGDNGRIISTFGIIALLVIHSLEIYMCRKTINKIKLLRNCCIVIAFTLIGVLFDFGSFIDFLILAVILFISFIIKIILFSSCRKQQSWLF